MENKKGSMSTVILVIMTFVLVAFAWFSFYINSNEIKTELLDVYFLNKVYSDEFRLERDISLILENQIIENYVYSVGLEEKDEASKFVIDKFKEKIEKYGFKYYNINYDKGYFYFSGELNEAVMGCFDNDKLWKWGDFSNKKECVLGVIYRPNINFKLNIQLLGFERFEDYINAVNKCRGENEVEKCLKLEIDQFDISFDENERKATFTTKRFYFISDKLTKIEFEEEFT